MEEGNLQIVIVYVASIIGIWIILYFFPIGLWLTARISGVRIPLMSLMLMKFKKVPQALMVRSMIECDKGEINLSLNELESMYLSGRNIENIVHGLIYAKNKKIRLSVKDAIQLDSDKVNIIESLSNQ